jgi:hypothetical protein
MEKFYINARVEWTQIAGEPLAFSRHRFKMESRLPTIAKPWTGACKLSVVWRSLARKAEEVSAVMEHQLYDDRQMHTAACRHLDTAAAAHKTLCNSQQAIHGPEVKAWAASLAAAWGKSSAR